MPARAPLRPLPPPGGWRERLADLTDRVGLSTRPWIALLTVAAALAVVASGVVFTRSKPSTAQAVAALPKATHAGAPATGSPASAGSRVTSTTEAGATTTTAPELVVHVVGAVVRPGVHRLAPGSRVADAIDAAGGVTPEADATLVNAARPLADGEQVRVPRRGETPPPTEPPPTPGRAGGAATTKPGKPGTPGQPVNVNTASEAELQDLPGIGPTMAANIVRHRTTKGPFTNVDQLEEVPGIGPARLEQLRPLVTA